MEVSHYIQYFGIASYASKIALNRLDASHVLVSYTSDVEPWDSVDTLMVDSGGYSLVNTDRTEYQTSDEEYLDNIQEHDAEYAMLRDYPLGSDPDATVPELQQLTTENQRKLFDRWDIERKRTHISTADNGWLTSLLERINVASQRRYAQGKVWSAVPSHKGSTETTIYSD